ncbi:MAG TPA: hypothetical protein VGF48_02990 [Thermoanaerobaculia bacterium]|jgi:hypothetical protein
MNRTTKTTLQYGTLLLPVPLLVMAVFLFFVFPPAGCGLMVVGVLLLSSSTFVFLWAAKATWTGQYRGSTIRVYNEVVLSQLFVDDQLLAQQAGLALSADMRGTATIDGQPAHVIASIAGTFVLHCRCYVDGTEVVMTEVEV